MGKWIGYHLSVGPGERDPAAVAAELRAQLPEGMPDACDPADPNVWIEEGIVHWESDREHGVPFGFWDGAVSSLDVPSAWALGIYSQEVEYHGGGSLYAWLDGEFVQVDEFHGQYGNCGRDVVEYFEREWGVTGGVVG